MKSIDLNLNHNTIKARVLLPLGKTYNSVADLVGCRIEYTTYNDNSNTWSTYKQLADGTYRADASEKNNVTNGSGSYKQIQVSKGLIAKVKQIDLTDRLNATEASIKALTVAIKALATEVASHKSKVVTQQQLDKEMGKLRDQAIQEKVYQPSLIHQRMIQGMKR